MRVTLLSCAIGLALAVATCTFARVVGLDRDRAFYPTVAIVVASYYALFAVVGGSLRTLALESVFILAFVGMSVLGFRSSLWWAAAALAGHGVFDLLHGQIIENAGVPPWWPGFCLGFDVAAGAWLFLVLTRAARPPAA